ncbi:hypothetical protein L0U85_10925 [Glycomyces sp. L485]|uniref:hypothetical protein n=1 Tax=Glycomyces sp. L485 TaxID=2909235 RepID=UPI001F4B2328|nr:hypothetical protein [Glycomyces sp. L485]MCH7231356.1 hypothetical protein [Glycomyces sp. L485]
MRRFERIGTRVAVSTVIFGFVAMIVAVALGAAEVYPYEYAVAVSLVAFCVPVGLALLFGAVAGMYILGGWRLAPLGVVFTAGFAGLVLGVALPHTGLRDLSVAVFGVLGGLLCYLGSRSGRAPASKALRWSNIGMIVVGTPMAVFSYAADFWAGLLGGVMAASCGIGASLSGYGDRGDSD